MRICFLARELGHGGAQRQLALLVRGLYERGHTVTVAVFYGGGQFVPELSNTGVSLIDLRKGGRWNIIGFSWRLITCLRRIRPDILHSYLGVPNILSIGLRLLLSNDVRIVWGVRASNMAWERYDWLLRWSHRAERLLARFPDLIIVNSQAGFDHAAENGFPRGTMVVVPNGIDVERFKPDRGAGMRVRQEWGVGHDDILIGLIGRIDPMKDHTTFLRAAARIKPEKAGARFVCVGDGPEPYKRSMRLLASNLQLDDVLIWAGARDDIAAVYNAIDVACSSSAFGEGFSNVIGEAMACGIPCVVTNVGDSARIVGDFGRVVPPGDPSALASALLDTTEDIASASDWVVRSRRERIVSQFSTSKLIDRTEAVLQALADSCRQ